MEVTLANKELRRKGHDIYTLKHTFKKNQMVACCQDYTGED
uniref:Uncharacterized protein n=1 Tax=Arundo donax TaxID=35708 RepID=A0A0A9FBU0_ARUDO